MPPMELEAELERRGIPFEWGPSGFAIIARGAIVQIYGGRWVIAVKNATYDRIEDLFTDTYYDRIEDVLAVIEAMPETSADQGMV